MTTVDWYYSCNVYKNVAYFQIQVQDVNDNCPVIVPANHTLWPIPALHSYPLFDIVITDEDIDLKGQFYFAGFYDVTM